MTESSDYCFEHLIKILVCIIHENMYTSGISAVAFYLTMHVCTLCMLRNASYFVVLAEI